MSNPWGLSAAQEIAVRALCEFGSNKHAARALGLSPKTIEAHLGAARKKMAAGDSVLRHGRAVYLIQFDRWDRGHEPNVKGSRT